MQIDDKAKLYLKKAKESGISMDEAFSVLTSKGYEVGAKQPLKPLTEAQKQKGIEAGDRAVLANQDVSKGQSALQGAFQSATFGLGDEIIGALSPSLTIEQVRQQQEDIRRANPKSAMVGEVGGALLGVGGLAKLGAKALPKVAGSLAMTKVPQGANLLAKAGNLALNTGRGSAVGGSVAGLYGFGGAEGSIEERFDAATDDAKLGALFGGAIPPLVATAKGVASPITKGVKKLFERTTPKAKAALNEVLKETKGSLNIDDVVGSDKGIRALYNAVDADEKVAKAAREMSKTAQNNSAYDTQNIVKKTLGFDDITKAKAKAGENYGNLFKKVKNKPIGEDVYNNKTLQGALKKARADDLTDEMIGLKDNSLGVAQKVKEQLDDMINGSYKTGEFGSLKATPMTGQLMKIKTAFVQKLDKAVPEYAKVRANFGSSSRANSLLESIDDLKGNLGGNEAKGLLTNKNRKAMIDIYGSDKANKFIKEIDLRSVKNDRLRKLSALSEKKLTGKEPLLAGQPFRRESLESLGSVVGSKIDKNITAKQRDIRRVIGENILGQSELPRLNPMVEQIMQYNPFSVPTQTDFIIGTQPLRGR